MDKMTLEKFEEATEAVSRVTLETKLVYSEYYSGVTGNKVYFKPENMQYTGAYKVRGAYYKISTLSEEEREKGLITASAGNAHSSGFEPAAEAQIWIQSGERAQGARHSHRSEHAVSADAEAGIPGPFKERVGHRGGEAEKILFHHGGREDRAEKGKGELDGIFREGEQSA